MSEICQDPLESLIWGGGGEQRYQGGYSDNPSVKEFMDNTISLRVQGSTAIDPLRGNYTRKRDLTLIVDDTPLPKRRRSTNK